MPVMKIRKESEQYYDYISLIGTISYQGPTGNAPVVVAAYSKEGGNRNIAHCTLLHEPGPFELIVLAGEYMIVSFLDLNADLTYQPGEPIGQFLDTPFFVDNAHNLIMDVNLTLSLSGSESIDFPAGSTVAEPSPDGQPPNPLHYTSPGTVTDLNDPIFDFENGFNGYWHPTDFFKRFGGNIHFLEPYDPSKIPVLFIHGATGSPRGWKYQNHFNLGLGSLPAVGLLLPIRSIDQNFRRSAVLETFQPQTQISIPATSSCGPQYGRPGNQGVSSGLWPAVSGDPDNDLHFNTMGW